MALKKSRENEEGWTFGNEGEYAVDKGNRAHRITALGVFCLWVGLTFYLQGLGYAIRAAAFYLIPLACIWWPEVMGRFRGFVSWRDPVDAPSHGGCLLWAAWLWMLLPAVVFLIAKSLAWH